MTVAASIPVLRARLLVLWSTPTDIDAFEEHYRKVHIPLSHRMGKLLTYTVSRNVGLVRGELGYYLIGELEWNSIDDLREDFRSPEGRATAQDVETLSQWSSGVQSVTYEVEET